MRVCQGRINIEAHTKLESVADTIHRNMRVCQEKIHIEAQTKQESVDDTINRNKGATRKRFISRHKPN